VNRKLFAGVDYQIFAVGSDRRPKVTTQNRKSQNDMTVTGLIYERGNKKTKWSGSFRKILCGYFDRAIFKEQCV
jgi:hypothetical protein